MYNNANIPKISFIIPVYNSEKFIKRCLNSILNQVYKNIEIICVNDFSSDKSLDLLNEFAKNDSRITVINNPSNLGAGNSRNIGLDLASGEYVFFVDSDDCLTKNALNFLQKVFEQYMDLDVIVTLNNDNDYATGFTIKPKNVPENITNRVINIFNTPECIEYVSYSPWCKIIKKDFLIENNIRFESYNSLEDIEHTIEILIHAKKILFLNEITYNYTTNRPFSVVTKKNENINVIILALQKVEQYSENFDTEIRKKLLKKIYRTLCDTAYCAYNDHKISYHELKNIFQKYLDLDIIKSENLSYCNRIYSHLSKDSERFFRLYSFARNIIKQLFPTFFKIYLINKNYKKVV